MTIASDLAAALQLFAAHINDVRAALDEHGLPGTGAPTSELGDLVRSIVPSIPVNTVRPTISGRNAGSTLTLSTGSWAGSSPITYTFEWLRDGVVISGATASTLDTEEEDEGDVIIGRVTATNSQGSISADSDPVALSDASVSPVLASSDVLLASSDVEISTLYEVI